MACGHSGRGASTTADQEETNGCSLFTFIKELAQPPRNIFIIYKTTAAKRSPWGWIQLLTSFVTFFGQSCNKE
jgi:hypothetical protein